MTVMYPPSTLPIPLGPRREGIPCNPVPSAKSTAVMVSKSSLAAAIFSTGERRRETGEVKQ